MPVALDLMQLAADEKGAQKPALHPSRMEKMLFVRYSCPPRGQENMGEYHMWLECVNYLCDDLHWLLQQPHDRFWCQAIFDESLHRALDSFLRYCPRSSEALAGLPESAKHKQQELCRLVFMTFLRLSTHKESKENFITPSVFGEILYENFIFDIPKILDICSLFGKSNSALLTKMICNIFNHQPKYTDDLKLTVPTIVQAFSNIASQCGVKMECSSLTPQKLDSKSNGVAVTTIEELQDLTIYLCDIGTTLLRFLEVYPEGCQAFNEAQFCFTLANFYETVVPVLTEKLKQAIYKSPVDRKRTLVLLHRAKKDLLAIFHFIVNHVCLLPVIENGNDITLVTSKIEEFLHISTSILSERRFLAAYEGMFAFKDDIDLLQQASTCVDASQFEYIHSAINSAFATYGKRKSPHGDTNTGGRTSPDGAPDSVIPANPTLSSSSSQTQGKGARPKTSSSSSARPLPNYKESVPDKVSGSASAPQPSDIELESLICAVKDILPHLGEGYIEAALRELGWDQERVISSVLEDSLPPSLGGLCQDMPRQQRAVNQGDGETSLVDSRRNIFDNDEYDVFHSKTIKTENIHQGKKEVKVDLDEKSVTNIVKSKYGDYGTWERKDPEDMADQEDPRMYDDEYDDTYDTTNVGADDADSADELAYKTVPRVLLDVERKKAKMEGRLQSESGESDSNDEEERNGNVKKDEFVQDPAKLREQAAQRRQSQAANRGRRGGGPPRNFDVKGNTAGQGQSKDVIHNRRNKEKFKGQRNKAGADKKMSKGMF